MQWAFFMLTLKGQSRKVSKSRKQFLVSRILPKNEPKSEQILLFLVFTQYYSLKEDAQISEFCFGRIQKTCFRDLLKFSKIDLFHNFLLELGFI